MAIFVKFLGWSHIPGPKYGAFGFPQTSFRWIIDRQVLSSLIGIPVVFCYPRCSVWLEDYVSYENHEFEWHVGSCRYIYHTWSVWVLKNSKHQFHDLSTCLNHRNWQFWSSRKGYVLIVEGIAQTKWEQNMCESGTVFGLSLDPLPVIVIIRIFTFLVKDSNDSTLNLHVPLSLGRGTALPYTKVAFPSLQFLIQEVFLITGIPVYLLHVW